MLSPRIVLVLFAVVLLSSSAVAWVPFSLPANGIDLNAFSASSVEIPRFTHHFMLGRGYGETQPFLPPGTIFDEATKLSNAIFSIASELFALKNPLPQTTQMVVLPSPLIFVILLLFSTLDKSSAQLKNFWGCLILGHLLTAPTINLRIQHGETASSFVSAIPVVFVDMDNIDVVNSLVVPQNAQFFTINKTESAITQMASVISSLHDAGNTISAIHIVSHGSPASLALGSTPIIEETISSEQANFQKIASFVSANTDLFLYGCNVAATQQGEQFVKSLSSAMGTKAVAASVNTTGSPLLGADWNLEFKNDTPITESIQNDGSYFGTLVTFNIAGAGPFAFIYQASNLNCAGCVGASCFCETNSATGVDADAAGLTVTPTSNPAGGSFTFNNISGAGANSTFQVTNFGNMASNSIVINGPLPATPSFTFGDNTAANRFSSINFNVVSPTLGSATFSASTVSLATGTITATNFAVYNAATFTASGVILNASTSTTLGNNATRVGQPTSVTFQGAGSVTLFTTGNLSPYTFSGTGAVTLNTNSGAASTVAAITSTGAVSITATSGLTTVAISTTGGSIVLSGSSVAINGNLNASTTVSVTGAATTGASTSSITAATGVSFSNTLALGASLTVNNTTSGAVQFTGAVSGSGTLAVAAANSAITFSAGITGVTVNVTAATTTAFNGAVNVPSFSVAATTSSTFAANITSAGAVSVTGPAITSGVRIIQGATGVNFANGVTLGANLTVNNTTSGPVQFQGAVSGTGILAVAAASSAVSFSLTVDGVGVNITAATSNTFSGAIGTGTAVNGFTITATGANLFNVGANVTSSNGISITSTGGNNTLRGLQTTAGSISLSAAGTNAFNGNVSSAGTLSVSGPATAAAGTLTLSGVGGVTFSSTLQLLGAGLTTINNSTSGNISIGNISASGTAHDLTIDNTLPAGQRPLTTGTIDLAGGNLILRGNGITNGAITNVANLTINTGTYSTGSITVAGFIDITASTSLTFTSTPTTTLLAQGGTVTINSPSILNVAGVTQVTLDGSTGVNAAAGSGCGNVITFNAASANLTITTHGHTASFGRISNVVNLTVTDSHQVSMCSVNATGIINVATTAAPNTITVNTDGTNTIQTSSNGATPVITLTAPAGITITPAASYTINATLGPGITISAVTNTGQPIVITAGSGNISANSITASVITVNLNGANQLITLQSNSTWNASAGGITVTGTGFTDASTILGGSSLGSISFSFSANATGAISLPGITATSININSSGGAVTITEAGKTADLHAKTGLLSVVAGGGILTYTSNNGASYGTCQIDAGATATMTFTGASVSVTASCAHNGTGDINITSTGASGAGAISFSRATTNVLSTANGNINITITNANNNITLVGNITQTGGAGSVFGVNFGTGSTTGTLTLDSANATTWTTNTTIFTPKDVPSANSGNLNVTRNSGNQNFTIVANVAAGTVAVVIGPVQIGTGNFLVNAAGDVIIGKAGAADNQTGKFQIFSKTTTNDTIGNCPATLTLNVRVVATGAASDVDLCAAGNITTALTAGAPGVYGNALANYLLAVFIQTSSGHVDVRSGGIFGNGNPVSIYTASVANGTLTVNAATSNVVDVFLASTASSTTNGGAVNAGQAITQTGFFYATQITWTSITGAQSWRAVKSTSSMILNSSSGDIFVGAIATATACGVNESLYVWPTNAIVPPFLITNGTIELQYNVSVATTLSVTSTSGNVFLSRVGSADLSVTTAGAGSIKQVCYATIGNNATAITLQTATGAIGISNFINGVVFTNNNLVGASIQTNMATSTSPSTATNNLTITSTSGAVTQLQDTTGGHTSPVWLVAADLRDFTGPLPYGGVTFGAPNGFQVQQPGLLIRGRTSIDTTGAVTLAAASGMQLTIGGTTPPASVTQTVYLRFAYHVVITTQTDTAARFVTVVDVFVGLLVPGACAGPSGLGCPCVGPDNCPPGDTPQIPGGTTPAPAGFTVTTNTFTQTSASTALIAASNTLFPGLTVTGAITLQAIPPATGSGIASVENVSGYATFTADSFGGFQTTGSASPTPGSFNNQYDLRITGNLNITNIGKNSTGQSVSGNNIISVGTDFVAGTKLQKNVKANNYIVSMAGSNSTNNNYLQQGIVFVVVGASIDTSARRGNVVTNIMIANSNSVGGLTINAGTAANGGTVTVNAVTTTPAAFSAGWDFQNGDISVITTGAVSLNTIIGASLWVTGYVTSGTILRASCTTTTSAASVTFTQTGNVTDGGVTPSVTGAVVLARTSTRASANAGLYLCSIGDISFPDSGFSSPGVITTSNVSNNSMTIYTSGNIALRSGLTGNSLVIDGLGDVAGNKNGKSLVAKCNTVSCTAASSSGASLFFSGDIYTYIIDAGVKDNFNSVGFGGSIVLYFVEGSSWIAQSCSVTVTNYVVLIPGNGFNFVPNGTFLPLGSLVINAALTPPNPPPCVNQVFSCAGASDVTIGQVQGTYLSVFANGNINITVVQSTLTCFKANTGSIVLNSPNGSSLIISAPSITVNGPTIITGPVNITTTGTSCATPGNCTQALTINGDFTAQSYILKSATEIYICSPTGTNIAGDVQLIAQGAIYVTCGAINSIAGNVIILTGQGTGITPVGTYPTSNNLFLGVANSSDASVNTLKVNGTSSLIISGQIVFNTVNSALSGFNNGAVTFYNNNVADRNFTILPSGVISAIAADFEINEVNWQKVQFGSYSITQGSNINCGPGPACTPKNWINNKVCFTSGVITNLTAPLGYSFIGTGAGTFSIPLNISGTPITIAPAATPSVATITTATEAGNVVTITTAAAHGFAVGQSVTISGVGVNGYNGTFTIATTPTTTTFTYLATNLGLGNSSGGTATGLTSITTATEAGNVVTITTVAAHGFAVGQSVTISGVGVNGYNGTFTIATTPTTTTFTYLSTNLGLGNSSGGTATGLAGATEAGNVVTITTSTPHGLFVGQSVTISSVGVGGYNGNATVTATPTSTSFTYTSGTAGLGPSGGGSVATTGTCSGDFSAGGVGSLNIVAPGGSTITPVFKAGVKTGPITAVNFNNTAVIFGASAFIYTSGSFSNTAQITVGVELDLQVYSATANITTGDVKVNTPANGNVSIGSVAGNVTIGTITNSNPGTNNVNDVFINGNTIAFTGATPVLQSDTGNVTIKAVTISDANSPTVKIVAAGKSLFLFNRDVAGSIATGTFVQKAFLGRATFNAAGGALVIGDSSSAGVQPITISPGNITGSSVIPIRTGTVNVDVTGVSFNLNLNSILVASYTGGITVQGLVDNAAALTLVNSPAGAVPVTLVGSVSVNSLSFSGTNPLLVNFNAVTLTVATAGITIPSPVVLTGTNTVTSSQAATNVVFNSTIDGNASLAVTAPAQANFLGNIGATTPLTFLNVNSSSSLLKLCTLSVTQSSTFTVPAVTIDTTNCIPRVLNVIGNAAISNQTIKFTGTVDGASTADGLLLALNSNMAVEFDGVVGGPIASPTLASLDASSGLVKLGNRVSTTTFQRYKDVTLLGNVTLTGSAISFTSSGQGVNGGLPCQYSLAVAGNTTVAAVISNITSFTPPSAPSTLTLATGSSISTCTLDINLSNVTLSISGTVSLTTPGILTMGSVSDASGAATLNLSGGTVKFTKSLTLGACNANPLGTLNVTSSGTIIFDTTAADICVYTKNSQSYTSTGIVDLQGSHNVDLTALVNGSITLNGTNISDTGSDSNLNLSATLINPNALVTTGINLNTGITNPNAVKQLTASTNATIFLQQSTYSATTQSFTGDVVLKTDVTVGATTFNSRVESDSAATARNLTTGVVVFKSSIGDVFPLNALTVSGTATSSFAGPLIQVQSLMTGSGAVTFNLPSTPSNVISIIATATSGNAVTIGGPIDAATATGPALSVTASTAGISINNNVGGTNALASLTLNSGSNTTAINGNVNTTSGISITAGTISSTVSGAQQFTVSTTSGNASFNGIVSAANANITVNLSAATAVSGQSISFANTITAANLTISNANAPVTFNNNVTTTSGTQQFNSQVYLGGNVAFTGGTINFAKGLDNSLGSSNDFTASIVTSATATLSAGAGNTKALGSFSVSGAGTGITIGGCVITKGTQTYSIPVTLTVNGCFTSNTAGSISFNKILGGTKSLTITTNAGAATFGDTITAVSSLVVNASPININANISLNAFTIAASPTGATETGTTVTITTTAAHGFTAGQSVHITGVGVTGYNGTFIIASVPTSTTFTFTAAAGLGASGGGSATTAVAIFNGAVVLPTSSAVAINTCTATFASTLNGTNATLTVNGDGVFTGAVGSTSVLTLLTVTGNTTLSASVTANTQNYSTTTGNTFVTANITLTGAGTAPTIIVGSGGPGGNPANLVSSPAGNTLVISPDTTYLQVFGSKLGFAAITGPTNNSLTGNHDYPDGNAFGNVQVSGNATVTANGSVSFGTISCTGPPPCSLTVQTSNAVSFNDTVNLGGPLTVTAAQGININTASITTTGFDQNYNGSVYIGASITNLSGNNINFNNGDINAQGGVSPSLTVTGNLIVQNGNIGTTNQLNSISVTGNTTYGPNGDDPSGMKVKTTGNQTYSGILFISGTAVILYSQAKPIIVAGAIVGINDYDSNGDGIFDSNATVLTISSTTSVLTGGANDNGGANKNPGSLITTFNDSAKKRSSTGQGSTYLCGTFNFRDNAIFQQAVNIVPVAVNITSASEAGSTVTIVTSAAHNLSLGDVAVISGVAVAGYNGTYIVATVANSTTFTYTSGSTGLVLSSGGQVGCTGGVTVKTTNSALLQNIIEFDSTIDGKNSLTVQSATSILLQNSVGQTTQLTSLTVKTNSSTDTIQLGAAAGVGGFFLKAANTVTFSAAASAVTVVLLANDVTINATTTNISSVDNAVSNMYSLTINGTTTITANSTIQDILNLTLNGNSTINLPASIAVAGTAIFGSALTQYQITLANNSASLSLYAGVLVQFLGTLQSQAGTFANITAASETGTTVTITTAAAHGYVAGQSVAITGVTVAGYNGTFTINSVPTSTTFTYTAVAGLGASGSGTASGQQIGFSGVGTLQFLNTPASSISASSAFIGTLIIQNGVLKTDNSNTLTIAGPVTIRNGATLTGNATFAGAVTVSDGGAISPSNLAGSSVIGTITFTGAGTLTFTSGGTFVVDILNASTYDKIVSANAVTLPADNSASLVIRTLSTFPTTTFAPAPTLINNITGGGFNHVASGCIITAVQSYKTVFKVVYPAGGYTLAQVVANTLVGLQPYKNCKNI